jgi:tetratricopeptide (TPR) repeat protein
MVKRKKQPRGPVSAEALRRHLKQKPDDGAAWLALTHALLDQPPGPELLNAAKQSLRCLPDDAQAWIQAAVVQQRTRGTEAALLWLEQAMARNPGQPAPHLAQAKLRLNQFQLVEALAAADRAVELSGGSADALRMRGDINLQGRHWEEALADYRALEQSGASDAHLMHQIGSCYFGLDEPEAAERHFRKALKRNPHHEASQFALALSYLSRLQGDKAEALLSELVRAPGGNPQAKRKAKTTLAVLEEHRRLEPELRQALASGDVSPLQSALNDAPGVLLQREEAIMERFRQLAAIFRDHAFDVRSLAQEGDPEAVALLEAESLCAEAMDIETLAGLLPRLESPAPGTTPAMQGLFDALSTVRQRADFDATSLHGPNGEAWLRYWHARLLQLAPETRPGQFKAVDAALPGKPRFDPEFVAPLVRELLGQFLPSVPSGLARALFLYASLRVLQPFTDGNSRVARFLMNAEFEAAGLAPVVIPASSSSAMNRALDSALFEGRVGPLADALVAAQHEAARQAREMAQADR